MAEEDDIQKRIEALDELVDAKNWDALEQAANQFIEDYPDRAEGFFARGVSKQPQEQYIEVIIDYDKAIDLDPKNARAYNKRGNVKSILGQFEEAIKDYVEAIRLKPNFSKTFNDRGNAKGRLRLFEEAIKDFDKAIELNPNEEDYRQNLSNVLAMREANKTRVEFLASYQDAIRDITDPQEITKQFEKDINRSHVKLYGFSEEFIDDDSENKYPTPLKNSLAYKADKAASWLRIWIIIIVLCTLALIYFDYSLVKIIVEIWCHREDLCTLPTFNVSSAEESIWPSIFLLSKYSLTLLLVTTPFVTNARRANREYKEEINRYFSLKSDKNMMLYWSAIEKDSKQEHMDTMFTHLSENSVANMSFQMSHPKLASRQSDRDEKSKGFF